MLRYIMRRLLYSLITLWVIVSLTFILMHSLPGNPLGEGAEKLPKATKEMLLKQYGLDRPMWEQYVEYVAKVAQGDLGFSFQFPARKVTEIIQQGFPVSLELGIWSMTLALIVGLFLGIIAALRHSKWQDYSASFIAVLGVSIPSFILGPLLGYFVGVKLGWLPPALWESPIHRIMPSVALSFGTIAILTRMMRTSMLDVINMDYIKTAKSKGLGRNTIVWKHMIRNAMLPVLTIFGPTFVNVITGTLVIEQIFAVPGLGRHFVQSINQNDYTMIGGLTIFYSVMLVVVIFLTDILYGFIDPRIRLGKGR